MTTPDVRAFYTTLGIELPGWPKLEAPIRCFAQPDAHNHDDRSPSCSSQPRLRRLELPRLRRPRRRLRRRASPREHTPIGDGATNRQRSR